MQHEPHQHDHATHRSANRKRLALTLLLAGGYMLAEVVGGIISNSLALLADAAHMLSDTAALGLSLFAVWIAERPAGSHRTYGFYRFEILAALLNGAALIAIAIYIFIEAYQRLQEPPNVMGAVMMWIAVGGFVKQDETAHGELLKRLRTIVRQQFGIDHITIQIEPADFDEQHPQI
jgi:cobalt-zinc-cadmium efflux system protein